MEGEFAERLIAGIMVVPIVLGCLWVGIKISNVAEAWLKKLFESESPRYWRDLTK